MKSKWFNWYADQMDSESRWAVYRDKYLCPCCFMPTLWERTRFDICLICDWEDDGQDTGDATMVIGGPNGDYSLEEARLNFQEFGVMYRPSDKQAFEHSHIDKSERKQLYQAYIKSIQSDLIEDWKDAIVIENRLIKREY